MHDSVAGLRQKDLDAIYSYTCNCNQPTNQADEVPAEILKEAARIAKGLYDGTIVAGTIDEQMALAVAGELRKAVIEGFGKDFTDLTYDTPDYNMLQRLEKDVYHFSAAKNYQQLKSMSMALRDDQGALRSFNDFKRDAAKITSEYNGRHLRSEYDTAVVSAQMGSRWSDLQAHTDTHDIWEYDAVIDSHTSTICRGLNGTRKPSNDDFWNKYYPPNHFGPCRSDVAQHSGGSTTPEADIKYPEKMHPMFETNLAKMGLVFPPGHPYYTDCPRHIIEQLDQYAHNPLQQ